MEPTEPVKRPFQFSLRALMLGVTLFALLCAWCMPSIKEAREAANRAHCLGLHSGLISMALMNYESVHGHFPPAYIADEDGKPMHSWRVLILPYLGENELYRRYNFSEPWNGPNNRRLAREIPHEYRCPSASPADPLSTNFVAVIGKETIWPGEKTVSIAEITDGTHRTLAVVEVADSNIHWMEPRDMTIQQAMAGVNRNRTTGISSNHSGGVTCGFSNMSRGFLADETSPEAIKALLTKDGGEEVHQDDSNVWRVHLPGEDQSP